MKELYVSPIGDGSLVSICALDKIQLYTQNLKAITEENIKVILLGVKYFNFKIF